MNDDPQTTETTRRERYAVAIHDAMEPDLSLVDQEPAYQALIARAAEAAEGVADTELAAASAVPVAAPPTEQAALREQIAEAIRADLTAHRARRDQGLLGIVPRLTDAVLSVLPPPADRAAVLREAAARYEEILANANTGQDPRYWTAVRDITLGLRRLAAETPHTETPDARTPCDGCGHPEHPAHECPVTLYGEHCACDEPQPEEAAPPREPHPTEADLHHALAVFARFHGRDTTTPAAPETVHACPPDGSGLTPCCGRTPFELPRTDRISSEPAAVTCAPAVVAQPGKETDRG